MTKLKVLVVDDAAFIRDLVRKTLRARFPGMEVEEAIHGRKAQQLLNRESFDLILCDWEMPEMSGIELLTWLRKEQENNVPFVMVTSRGDKENVVEAIQAGVTDYIGKPFSSESLLNKVIKVMSKRHDLRALMGKAPTAAGAMAKDSISALTGGRPAASPASSTPRDGMSALTGGTAAPAAKSAQPASSALPKIASAKGTGHIRFGSVVSQCIIKGLSLKQISLVCRTQDGVPALLETVVIDLQQGEGGDIARINAYVHQLQAAEQSPDSGIYNVTVNIVDQDPAKLSYLSKMIARGTTSGKYVPGA
ncbi:response regulator [Motiliproteus sediminis]|uniref:response regulator n=1 Tax=Motiliproteus sediminis TaxID=1468178 RepID=UPI001AEFCBDB|nr:response regulator [Motiliproteus sediminis]